MVNSSIKGRMGSARLCLSVIELILLAGSSETSISSNIFTVTSFQNQDVTHYKPTWDSLDSRPLPQWYDEAKFGIFIHWGVFSVPSFGSEWFCVELPEAILKFNEQVENYRPELIWSDGEWESTDEYWTSKEFIAWLYNDSPVKDTVVVNDRWGKGDVGRHGDYYTYSDRYNPGVLQPHKWENCMTIDKESWGFRRNAKLSDYLTVKELVQTLAETVSCGGNLLMNIGPTKDGIIAPIYEDRLRGMGAWLKINGEAIYSTKPWTYQNDTLAAGVWYTKSGSNGVANTVVYATVLNWPKYGHLKLAAPQLVKESTVTLLGYTQDLQWMSKDGIDIQFPNKANVASEWAWVLKMTNVTN